MKVVYTNHRGERRERDIDPVTLYWGSTEFHPDPQWMLEVYDHGKKTRRDYALKDIEVPVGTKLIDL